MLELAKKYSFEGVFLRISAFSRKHQTCFVGVIESNAHLYEVLKKLPELIEYQNGGTNLAPTIKYIFDEEGASSAGVAKYEGVKHLIILATDGRASDQKAVKIEFANAREKGCVFDMICVGAGSVGSNASLNFGSWRSERIEQTVYLTDTCGRVSYEKSERSVLPLDSSECDLKYLQDLLENAEHGQYIGAYQRYEHIPHAVCQFLELRAAHLPAPKIPFKVDTTPFDQKCGQFVGARQFSPLPEHVDDALQNGKCVIWRNQYGTYLLVPFNPTDSSTLLTHSADKEMSTGGFQIKLHNCPDMVSGEIVIVEREQIPLNLDQTYINMFSSKLNQDSLRIFSGQFQILGNSGSVPMCRQLIQVDV
jgi:hypothetical protein